MPIQFYHEVFEDFLRCVNTINDTEDLGPTEQLTEQLIPQISMFMESESQRQELFIKFLRALGLPLVSSNHNGISTDGSLFTEGLYQFLLCNLEVKSDSPSGCNAYLQNTCYYVKFALDTLEGLKRICTNFPAFLVILEGMHFHSFFLAILPKPVTKLIF